MQKLFKYQKDIVERYKDAEYAPIFLQAGLGKSAIALRIIAHKFKTSQIDRALIIAPNRVHTQWLGQQIPMWLEDVKYTSLKYGGDGGAKSLEHFQPFLTDLQIICTNVDTFSTKNKFTTLQRWAMEGKCYIVLDEATVVKNISSKRFKSIVYGFNSNVYRGRQLLESIPMTAGRAALTGTPITNSILDIWAIMEFLQPNYFKRNFHAFKQRYVANYAFNQHLTGQQIELPITPIVFYAIKSLSFPEAQIQYGVTADTYEWVRNTQEFTSPTKRIMELKEILDKDCVFGKLTDYMDMPPQNYINRTVTMSKEQSTAYFELKDNYCLSTEDISVSSKLTLLLRLQQLSAGFIPTRPIKPLETLQDLFTVDIPVQEVKWFDNVPKLEALFDDIAETPKPIIVFTRFNAEAAKIFDYLHTKYRTALQTGWHRVGTIQDFQEGKYDIMVANIQVAAKGFNLQNCYQTMYYGNTFSLEDRLQSEGRTFRLGQTKPTIYFDYINNHTVDELVVKKIKERKDLMEYITKTNIKELLS